MRIGSTDLKEQHAGAELPERAKAADEPAGQLISPHWPLRLSLSGALTLLLMAAVGGPLWLAAPGAIVIVTLLVPVLSVAIAARLLFQALTSPAPPGAMHAAVPLAAAGAGALAAGVVALLAAAFQLDLTVLGSVLGGAVVCGTLVLAALLRSIEIRRWALSRKVFFIGSERQCSDLAKEIGRRGDLSLVGRIDIQHLPTGGIARGSLADTIARSHATTLVLSAEATRDEQLVAVASDLHARGLRVRALNDFYERHFAKVALSDLSKAWFLFDVAEIHRPRVYGKVKRLFEGALAAVLLALSLPLFPVIALMVRRSGPGPLFYRQHRVGKDGKVFAVTKFRTMTAPHAEEAAGWATQHVARITPAGRRLRRYRLDEIPQLWNVVRGDLALVGPRPEQPTIVERLSESIDFYPARHRVRPGLTGWAQVNGGYGGSLDGVLEKLQYDFFYIRRQSLRLDLLILLATVRTVLSGRGS